MALAYSTVPKEGTLIKYNVCSVKWKKRGKGRRKRGGKRYEKKEGWVNLQAKIIWAERQRLYDIKYFFNSTEFLISKEIK